MKKNELLFGALLLPIDYLALVVAGITAYSIRFGSTVTKIQPVFFTIPFERYVTIVLVTAVGWVVIFAWSGLYTLRSTRRIVEEIRKVIFACSTSVLIIIVLFFLQRDLFSSRFIILAAAFLAMLYVSIARITVLLVERVLFRRGIGVRNIVVLGTGHMTNSIAQEIAHRSSLGLHVKLQFDTFSAAAKEKILAYHERGHIDELIQTDPNLAKSASEEIYEFCDEHHIVFRYVAALFDTQSTNVAIQPIAGIPIVEIKKTPLDGWGRIVKRLFDICGALALFIVTGPVMLIAATAIFISSGRPIFFTRRDDHTLLKRVGQYGKAFPYFKFRTMVPGTDSLRYDPHFQQRNIRAGSPLVKILNDPRITRVGKILRKYSIDELPELLLVLKGDMSLVGPRPHLPEEVEKYERHHKRVLRVKPGITGLAQISGRSDLSFEDEVQLDTFYIENWALWLDLVILLKTPFVVLRRKSRKAL